MDLYWYCIEKSFEQLTLIIELINGNIEEYNKNKKYLFLQVGNSAHWVAVLYDKINKESFSFQEGKLLSALKAVDNNQKHELNCIDFQEVGHVGIKSPVDFNNFSFETHGVVWKNSKLNELGKFGNQNKNYNDCLLNKPVWNTIDEAMKILKKHLTDN